MNKNDVLDVILTDQDKESNHPVGEAFVVGEKIFIRTVTHHFTGRIKAILKSCEVGFLVLEDGAWIASDGRFTQAIEAGELDEVEPLTGLIRVNISSIIDAHPWKHPLPRTQK
jgi:hypothetical protein